MASPAVQIGTGTTITFDSGFFAQILSVNHSGISRGSIDTTHMGTTTARTFAATDLFDAGELEVEIHFNPDTRPPIDDAAETCTVTFPSTATLAGSAFMTGFQYGDPLEDKMTATATLKFSGDLTFTPAS